VSDRLRVTVVGGYLGAGKTTLLNALLRAAHGVRLAVLVNDFGSVNIDAALIENRSGETISLTNGCICCSIGSSLAVTLHELAARPDCPEHIIVEASGVADLGRLAGLAGSHPRLVLDCVIAVADAESVRALADDRYVGDLVRRQLSAADVIVLSKTDLIGADEQRRVRAWLAGEVPGARVLEGHGGNLFTALVLGGSVHEATPTHRYGDDHADRFATWSFAEDRPLDGHALRAALAALPPSVLRAKGIVTLAEAPDERFVLQLVGRRHSLLPQPTVVPAGGSVIVCIGLAGELDPRALDALFAADGLSCCPPVPRRCT
jgi:G3E family GTPase